MAGASRSVDELLAQAALDPANGVQVVAADRLASAAFDPGLPLFEIKSFQPSKFGCSPNAARSSFLVDQSRF